MMMIINVGRSFHQCWVERSARPTFRLIGLLERAALPRTGQSWLWFANTDLNYTRSIPYGSWPCINCPNNALFSTYMLFHHRYISMYIYCVWLLLNMIAAILFACTRIITDSLLPCVFRYSFLTIHKSSTREYSILLVFLITLMNVNIELLLKFEKKLKVKFVISINMHQAEMFAKPLLCGKFTSISWNLFSV